MGGEGLEVKEGGSIWGGLPAVIGGKVGEWGNMNRERDGETIS